MAERFTPLKNAGLAVLVGMGLSACTNVQEPVVPVPVATSEACVLPEFEFVVNWKQLGERREFKLDGALLFILTREGRNIKITKRVNGKDILYKEGKAEINKSYWIFLSDRNSTYETEIILYVCSDDDVRIVIFEEQESPPEF